MQNEHLPLHPSCTFKYARAVRKGVATGEGEDDGALSFMSAAV
jgi:hypothetical protein